MSPAPLNCLKPLHFRDSQSRETRVTRLQFTFMERKRTTLKNRVALTLVVGSVALYSVQPVAERDRLLERSCGSLPDCPTPIDYASEVARMVGTQLSSTQSSAISTHWQIGSTLWNTGPYLG